MKYTDRSDLGTTIPNIRYTGRYAWCIGLASAELAVYIHPRFNEEDHAADLLDERAARMAPMDVILEDANFYDLGSSHKVWTD